MRQVELVSEPTKKVLGTVTFDAVHGFTFSNEGVGEIVTGVQKRLKAFLSRLPTNEELFTELGSWSNGYVTGRLVPEPSQAGV